MNKECFARFFLVLSLLVICYTGQLSAMQQGAPKTIRQKIVGMGGAVLSTLVSVVPFSQSSNNEYVNARIEEPEQPVEQQEEKEDDQEFEEEYMSVERDIESPTVDGDISDDEMTRFIYSARNGGAKATVKESIDAILQMAESQKSSDTDTAVVEVVELSFENMDQLLECNKQEFESDSDEKKDILDRFLFDRGFFQNHTLLDQLLNRRKFETAIDIKNNKIHEALYRYSKVIPVLISFYKKLHAHKGEVIYRLLTNELRQRDEKEPIVILLKKTLVLDATKGMGEFRRNLINTYMILRGFAYTFEKRKLLVETNIQFKRRKRRKRICFQKTPSELAGHIMKFSEYFYIPTYTIEDQDEVPLQEVETQKGEAQEGSGWKCNIL